MKVLLVSRVGPNTHDLAFENDLPIDDALSVEDRIDQAPPLQASQKRSHARLSRRSIGPVPPEAPADRFTNLSKILPLGASEDSPDPLHIAPVQGLASVQDPPLLLPLALRRTSHRPQIARPRTSTPEYSSGVAALNDLRYFAWALPRRERCDRLLGSDRSGPPW